MTQGLVTFYTVHPFNDAAAQLTEGRKIPSDLNAWSLREGLKKKNCEKAVRLTALGGEGGVTPPQPDHFYL